MNSRTRAVVRAAVRNVVEQLEGRRLLSLTVDLRLAGGEKLAEVTGEDQTIDMELWAIIRGENDRLTDDRIQSIVGSIRSFKGGGVRGDVTAFRVEPFAGLASSDGSSIDLDRDGDLDVGSNDDDEAAGFFVARSPSVTYRSDRTDADGARHFKIADVQFVVTRLLDDADSRDATTVRFVPRRGDSSALWMEDGKVRTSGTHAVSGAAPVVLRRAGGDSGGGVFIGLDGDDLVIDGTDGDDDINVRLDPADGSKVQVLSGGRVAGVFNVHEVWNVEVRGWGGDDTIIVSLPGRADVTAEVSGGSGDDLIKGGGWDDTLKGGGGADTVTGGGGDDVISGGSGADDLDGRAGQDTLTGGHGDDDIEGASGDDELAGGAGDDSMDGDAGDDEITGGGDDDWIDGGSGDDELKAGSGDDEIVGGGGDDEVFGGGGDDSVAGGAGEDTLKGDGGDDEVTGGTDDDVVRGNEGEDTLWGGEGEDTIAGGGDADVLNVEQGVDYAKGSKYDTINNDKYRNPLKRLDDEAGLKAWLIDQAVKQWRGYFGNSVWRWHWYYCDCLVVRNETGPAVLNGAVAGSASATIDHSTTNVQEQGVDEADLVKTDGEYLYMVSAGELVIVDAWPASEMHVVSRTQIAGNLSGIYLKGDTLTVVSSTYQSNAPDEEEGTGKTAGWFGWNRPQTRVTVLDVSDRTEPEIVEQTTLDGAHSDTRMIGGRLYVVVNNWRNMPEPLVIDETPEEPEEPEEATDAARGTLAVYHHDWYEPPTDERYETEAEYRARLEGMSLEELLPDYETTVGDATTRGDLADLSNFYVPGGEDEEEYHHNMFSVVMFDVTDDEAGVKSVTSVAGLNGEVYASTDSLYVTATSWDKPISSWWWSGERQTDIYKFDLGANEVKLGGSGQVPGWIINQFALDEEEGILRIATTSDTSSGRSNNVFTLADTGKDLEIVGGITDLAFSERIYSVRFVGDRGYLVTFRQTDPLFTIDLSDPANPEVKGILKIPGYSSYLHPIADDLVIGVGRDATETGQVRGVQVSLFDVSDMENPRRLHTHTFGNEGDWSWNSWTAAEWDHHAFSYFAEQKVLALPMMTGSKYGLEVMRVDREAGFTSLGTVEHSGQAPLRSLRIGDALYSIGYDAIRVVDLADPGHVLKVLEGVIGPDYGYYYGGPIRIWPVRSVGIAVLN